MGGGVELITFKQELSTPDIFWETAVKLFETKLGVCFPSVARTGAGAIHITSDKGQSRCRRGRSQQQKHFLQSHLQIFYNVLAREASDYNYLNDFCH